VPAPYPRWLDSAVLYQVYPPSFSDSNGDGIGDLAGITGRLDYIRSLGCTLLWLNPCFCSPFRDGGYDISDYCRVAPRYGTNEDLKALIREAAGRDIRVCLDLVPGHTSIEHPWFRESCRAQPNRYTHWYIWTGSVQEQGDGAFHTVNGYAERDGNFVPNYYWCQPALNYGFARPDPARPWQLPVDHPDVREMREEMKRIIRFYLDLGASALRCDMAFSLVKNDPERLQTIGWWREVRRMVDREYPGAALLAEWGIPSEAVEAGFHADFLMHFHSRGCTTLFRNETPWSPHERTGPSFFSREGRGDISVFLEEYREFSRAVRGRGLIALPSGSHDMCRISQGRAPREIELVFAFLFTMPGMPCIYYGDEIGLRYQAGLAGKEGGYRRTGSRTPMQWDATPGAGFSTAPPERFYLPVDPDPGRPTVEAQERDPGSLLNRVRALAALRSATPALQGAAPFRPVFAEPGRYPFVYLRGGPGAGGPGAGGRMLIGLNPSGTPAEARFRLPGGGAPVDCLLQRGGGRLEGAGRLALSLEGLSYGIWRLDP
jgi:maltose alpha-D-glucosyltransferase/alpha-amylase